MKRYADKVIIVILFFVVMFSAEKIQTEAQQESVITKSNLYAEDEGVLNSEKTEQEKAEIKIEAEKEEYDKDEEISLTVTLTNQTKSDLLNIRFLEIIPKGYKAEINDEKTIDLLQKGDQIKVNITAVAELTGNNSDEKEKEQKSDYKKPLFITVIIVLLIILILLFILILRKKKQRDMISYIILFAFLASYLPPLQIDAAEKKTKHTIEAYETVSVENEELEFGILVTYETDNTYQEAAVMPQMTTEEITLTYQFWENRPIVKTLIKEWNKLYPNITIEPCEVVIGDNNENLLSYAGTNNMPDVFWINGTPDFAVKNGLLADMSRLWEMDADTKNVIGGINDFYLGYLGTEQKWTTPIRFYPTCAWLNMNYFGKTSLDMPDTDWTFEEMKRYVEDLSIDNNGGGWGISEAVTVITWYPIASDSKCISEFGWNGREFDLTNWAEGMMIEKEWRDNGYKAPPTMQDISGYENDGYMYYPDEEGLAAIRLDDWSRWERYWNTEETYAKQVYWVPYALPHTEKNKESDTNLASMLFGGISADTDYSREAYEVLKFFEWGAEGWNYKISKCDEIIASATYDEEMISITGIIPRPLDNCPITADENIWQMYEAKYPTNAAGGDSVGRSKYNIDRAPYFSDFLQKARTLKWTCYINTQILGYNRWCQEYYDSFDKYDGAYGVEDWVFEMGGDPYKKVQMLSDGANKIYKEEMDVLENLMKN